MRDLPSTGATSTSLLCRVCDHDASAWQRLTEIYGPLVYGWCRSFGVPAQDASDIVQDVFIKVHASIGAFRRDDAASSFRGWLWTITRNQVCDHYRAADRRPQPVGGSDAQLQWSQLPDNEPPSTTAPGEIESTLLKGLEYVRVEFREQTWQAFWRSTVDGVTTADVAEQLSMSVGAVRKARFRVLHRLREELDGLL